MSNATDNIIKNVRALYPDGRAWYLPDGVAIPYVTEDRTEEYTTEDGIPYVLEAGEGGIFLRLHEALATSEGQAFEDAMSFLNALLPDNDGFTMDDAIAWYRRLGIFNSGSVSLADMKAAIAQRYYGRGLNQYRQNYLYIQAQLQLAGFNVYVYENRFPDGHGGYITKSPDEILGTYPGLAQFADDVEFGDTEFGTGYNEKVVNYLEPSLDAVFDIGTNYRSTFFIAGATITTFADVPAGRETEFRQLILQLKPAQSVGYLFVNYV
jgi:hypothetical protein